jgi:hypothetical protein
MAVKFVLFGQLVLETSSGKPVFQSFTICRAGRSIIERFVLFILK